MFVQKKFWLGINNLFQELSRKCSFESQKFAKTVGPRLDVFPTHTFKPKAKAKAASFIKYLSTQIQHASFTTSSGIKFFLMNLIGQKSLFTIIRRCRKCANHKHCGESKRLKPVLHFKITLSPVSHSNTGILWVFVNSHFEEDSKNFCGCILEDAHVSLQLSQLMSRNSPMTKLEKNPNYT